MVYSQIWLNLPVGMIASLAANKKIFLKQFLAREENFPGEGGREGGSERGASLRTRASEVGIE